jgi:hypothetical protein
MRHITDIQEIETGSRTTGYCGHDDEISGSIKAVLFF